jgi:hypothetical protein
VLLFANFLRGGLPLAGFSGYEGLSAGNRPKGAELLRQYHPVPLPRKRMNHKPATTPAILARRHALVRTGRLVFALLVLLALQAIHASADIITPYAGGPSGATTSNITNGIPATNALLYGVEGLGTDLLGNLYLAHVSGAAVRRVNATNGLLTTVAGNGSFGTSGDGGAAVAAGLSTPSSVAVDLTGNIYLCDNVDSRVRKIDVATGVIHTVVGNDIIGYTGDDIPATNASLTFPMGIAVDVHGNLYIADTSAGLVRKVDAATGYIHRLAGQFLQGGHTGDGGPAVNARINSPLRIAVDASDNVYFIDQGNRVYIRRIDGVTGIITTIAGGGTNDGSSGFATNASLEISTNSFNAIAEDLAVDNLGSLYIGGWSQIWKVDLATGNISIIAGAGGTSVGFSGDGGPATNALLNGVLGLAASGAGDLYLTDSGNDRVRRITPDIVPPFQVLVDLTVSQSCLPVQTQVRSNLYLATVNGRLSLVLPNGTNVPGDVIVTNSTSLSAITVPAPAKVGGNLSISAGTNSTSWDLSQLTGVNGSLSLSAEGPANFTVGNFEVTGPLVVGTSGSGSISIGSPSVNGGLTVGSGGSGSISIGSPNVTGNLTAASGGGGSISIGSPGVSGGVTVSSGGSGAISIGSPDVGGDMTVTNGGMVTFQSPTVQSNMTSSVGDSTTLNVGDSTVGGNLKANAGSNSIVIVGPASVDGNLIVTANGGGLIDIGSPDVTGGMSVTENGGGTISIGSPDVTGGLVVTHNGTGTVSLGNPDVTGGLTVTNNGSGNVSLGSPTVGGDMVVTNGGMVTFQSPTVQSNMTSSVGDSTTLNVGAPTVGGNLKGNGGSNSIVIVGPASVTNNLDIGTGNGSTVNVGNPTVGGDVTLGTGNGSSVNVGDPNVSGDLAIGAGSGSTVSVGNPTVGSDLTIGTGSGSTVDVGNPIVGGDMTVTIGSASGTVDFSGAQVSGNTTLVVGDATTVSASTADGNTSVTLSNGPALMQAVLPAGTFTTNVVFSVTSLSPAAVTTLGGPTNGDKFSVTTVAAYRFAFAIPTLNQDASLTFDIQLAVLEAATRSEFLTALAAGNASVGVLGDAPGSTWQTFPICATNESPTPGGCVSLVFLDATGTPLPPDSTNAPAVVRFTGLAGHFSTYGVVLKQPVQLATSLTGGGALRLTWRGPASGVLETSTNLAPNSWSPAGAPTQQPDGSWRFDAAPTEPMRFYRFKSP